MKVQRESAIERKCKLLAQQKGWFQVKIEKASVRGFPDRLFIRAGKTVYVEFKNEVGRLSDEQVRVIAQNMFFEMIKTLKVKKNGNSQKNAKNKN